MDAMRLHGTGHTRCGVVPGQWLQVTQFVEGVGFTEPVVEIAEQRQRSCQDRPYGFSLWGRNAMVTSVFVAVITSGTAMAVSLAGFALNLWVAGRTRRTQTLGLMARYRDPMLWATFSKHSAQGLNVYSVRLQ